MPARVPAAIAVVALSAACAAPSARAPAAAGVPATARPVLDADFPDPFVLVDGDGLVAYATNGRRGGRRVHVQVSRSRDGATWSAPREAMPVPPPWAWADAPDIWAPEAIRIGEGYVLYFSARHASRLRPDGRTLCVGAATSDAPDGPFVPQARPLACGGVHGAIDASPFRDGDALWLYLKTDGNCCAAPTTVQVLALAADGLSIVGDPATVAGIGNDRPWEGGVVEAPQMLKRGSDYLMFYAGNDYGGTAYATGYATCAGPAGPCRDAPANPLLRTDARGVAGPGHPSVFRYAGHDWIAYHGWRSGRNGGGRRYRAMYIDRLDWHGRRPVVSPREALPDPRPGAPE